MNGNILQLAKAAKELAANRLLRPNYFGNVVGVGIGNKMVDDKATDTLCVRIYVQSKFDIDDVTPAALLPSSFLDIPTDIVEIGLLGRKGKKAKNNNGVVKCGSPIRLRTHISSVNTGASGTLGAVVKYVDDEKSSYILGCNHILAVNGRALDAEIISAALVEKPDERAAIAEFKGDFVAIRRGDSNYVDCALALITANQDIPASDELRIDSEVPIDPKREMVVAKRGAVTGLTKGKIVDIDADLFVDYSFGTFRFSNQVVIDSGKDDSEFATDGDSGAIVVVDDEYKRATAMVFAEAGRFAIACPLNRVFAELVVKKYPDVLRGKDLSELTPSELAKIGSGLKLQLGDPAKAKGS